MNRKYVWVGIAVLVCLALFVGGVSALEYNFQNSLAGWDNVSYSGGAGGVTGDSEVSRKAYTYSDTYALYIYSYRTGGASQFWIVTSNNTVPCGSNYWSFNVVDSWRPTYYGYIDFFDLDWNLINSSDNAPNYFADGHYELLQSGLTIALYVDGAYIGDISPGKTYPEMPYHIRFRFGSYSFPPTYIYIDDVLIDDEEGTIGTIPHSWYILRNWDNPNANGLHDGGDNKIYTHTFHTTYAWRNVTGYSERNPPADSIITKYFYTGEVIDTSSLSAKSADVVGFNLTQMLFHDDTEDDKYGLYYQQLKRGGEVLASDYFWFEYASASKPSGGTISFGKDSYVSGEIAEVTHHLDTPDFADYRYKGYIYSMSTGEQEEVWSISSQDGTENVNLADYNTGQYFALLRVEDKSSDWESDLAYDVMAVNEEVLVEGVTYNAETEAVLGTVNVSDLQGIQYYNTTSNASTGEYNISSLSVDIETDVNATKTNYTHNDFSFTPLVNGLYNIDIFMLPNISHITHHNTSIGGLVQSYPFYQNVSGATVNLWNGTWNTNTVANTMGYYIFENLTNGTYWINATCTGYTSSENEEIETNNGSFLYHYILLRPIFTLTVKASDASSHATITDFTAILNDGTPVDTTTASIDFTVDYGLHKVEASAEGYYVGLEYVYVDEDTTEILYLVPLEEGAEGGAGVYYPPPHLVEFRVQNVWGEPITGVSVTALGYETTMANLTWLEKLFGYSAEVEIYNSTMSGLTDSNGALSFFMVETIKYKMWFTNASQNISAYREIYPKDERYVITIGEIPEQKIAYWIITAQNNTANTGNITIHYCDYNSPVKTNWVNFSVYYGDNGTLVHTHNFTSPTDVNENTSIDLNASFVYKVKLVADHDDSGEIKSYSTVVFIMPEKPKFPIEGLEDWQISVFGMFVIILFSLIFGAYSAGVGGLVAAFMSASFYYFGFLPLIPKAAAYVIFPLIIIVAIINIISEQKGEVTG